MIITHEIDQVRASRWLNPTLSWGLVPTMGYLHQGHRALIQQARAENDRLAVSIYVNPTQFAPNEDLTTYPRSLEQDLAMLTAEKVDLVFTPNDSLMYPPGFQTKIILEEVTQPLEGASRPTHFQGVATVVAKLFNIIQPNRAYFGQKDAQQTVVIRQMTADLNFNVEMIICPTIRESDGLALSSRNVKLSAEQRKAAVVLYQALTEAAETIQAGERDGPIIRQQMAARIASEPLARLDYVSAADPATLKELNEIRSGVLLSTAVFFGNTRLIDNLRLNLT
jgi:pantoate--beta-alanine ligase